MMILIQFLISTAILLVMLYPFYRVYSFTRDSIRMYLYKRGHRVFTIPELRELGFTASVVDGVVEGTAVVKKDDLRYSKTFEATVVDEKELETRRKIKEEKEKLSYFEDPAKKFKNYDL